LADRARWNPAPSFFEINDEMLLLPSPKINHDPLGPISVFRHLVVHEQLDQRQQFESKPEETFGKKKWGDLREI
jgi:hypothetical protein